MKVLIAGWFSFELMGATAGDFLSKDVLCEWLDKENIQYDVALANPFEGGIDWEKVDAMEYTHVIFICGPFGNGWPLVDFLKKFSKSTLIGINLSMLQDLDEWNPFDFLLERDSSRTSNSDLVFLSKKDKVPVVGLVLVEPQKEYKNKARHKEANDAIYRLLEKQHCAVIPIDTRLDVPNKGGLRSPQEIESAITKMDMIVTTRLHGMVLGLKNGVPVLAVDAIEGGAKITKQAETIGWPNTFEINRFEDKELTEGFQFCLTEEAKTKAVICGEFGRKSLHENKQKLIDFFRK